MKVTKQNLTKEEKHLKFPRKKELELIEILAEQLEAYLQLAYEENGDAEETLEYMSDPELVATLPIANERLRHLAGMIYVHAQALPFGKTKVCFNEGFFEVEVFIQATPF